MVDLPESCDKCMYGVQCTLLVNHAGNPEVNPHAKPGMTPEALVKLVPNPCDDKVEYTVEEVPDNGKEN